jgi:ABC-type microcin C transport system permease subunit YejB
MKHPYNNRTADYVWSIVLTITAVVAAVNSILTLLSGKGLMASS